MKFKKLFTSFVFFGLTFSFFASAQGVVPCGQGSDPSNACTLCHLIVGINNVIKFGSSILIAVAVVAIFISGVMYIVSSGNEQAMTTAKGFLGSALKGFAIVLGAWLIVNVTMWVLSYNTDIIKKGSNWYTFECSTKSSTGNYTSTSASEQKTSNDDKNQKSWYFVLYNYTSLKDGENGPYETEDICEKARDDVGFWVSANYPCYEK